MTTTNQGRWYFWTGILLCPLAIALVFIQFSVSYLATPWYVPILTTLGAVLLLVAAAQRRSILRVVFLVLVTAFAGLQWFLLVSVMKLPEYQGPGRGQTIPAFTASHSDGRSFTEADLKDGTKRALVFFRGRW